MGCLLFAQAVPPPGQPDPRATQAPARGGAPSSSPGRAAPAAVAREIEQRSPWFIILNSPQDLEELWRKIERPDLILIRGDHLEKAEGAITSLGTGPEPSRSLVESVRIGGRVQGETADLGVELTVTVKGADPVWVPIRLDNQRVVLAREGARDLSLRVGDGGEWQVSLTGEGQHRIRVDLRVATSADPTRRRLSLAIPEAASTRVELDFSHRETDIIIGANEDFGQHDLGAGKGTRLTAHLSPRSKVEVSWSDSADSLGKAPPLLTAQGEIAIEVDAQQVRTRSSWSIRCVRGTARSLELVVDDDDQITELELDDQSMDDGFEHARGPGKLTIPLADPLRAGETKRLILKTRRSLAKSGARRIAFGGFPLSNAREQSGYIGITQSPNLWIAAAPPQGLYRIDPSKLPSDLRARPSTRLAYEFLDQPFLLNLAVEPSPAQVRGESRTYLQIEPDQARSETTIELTPVRGELFDLELGVAPGLQVVSVGPADVVESFHLTDQASGVGDDQSSQQARRLDIRLTPRARQGNKVSLKLTALEQIPALGSIKLGLFSFGRTTPVNSFYAVAVARGLAFELDDDTGRLRRAPEIKSRFQNPAADWMGLFLPKTAAREPLFLVDDGNSKFLPIRLTHQARLLHHETVLTAQVSPRSVEVLERTTLTVRHGALTSLQIHVPASFADRWELVERQDVERQELGPEPDGSRRYRLSFDRPILDQATLRFRYRLTLAPVLDSTTAREVSIPWIKINEGEAGLARVDLSPAPEIVVDESGPGWVRSSDDLRFEPAGEAPVMQFAEAGPGAHGRPFTFKARALAQVSLPGLVVPRLLVKTTRGVDARARTTARYWVESHGADFPFALPEGAQWIEARVDGRIVDRVDFDQSRSRYRLRFPADAVARPALVELEYQESAPKKSEAWQAPRLLDGAVILQALWEVRLPWSMALVGVPPGWSDENHWEWTGYSWQRRPGKETAGLNEWLLGAGYAASAVDDFTGSSLDDSDRYLFSQRGDRAALEAWIVPRSSLVGICSGVTLLIGVLAIFLKLRFRTIWLAVAGLAVLAAVLVEPSVTFLALQSAALGGLLSVLGLMIESWIERTRFRSLRASRGAPPEFRSATDSSLNRSSGVGSDDSTAIRIRVPSTLDHAPAAVDAPEARQEVRSSTLGRAL